MQRSFGLARGAFIMFASAVLTAFILMAPFAQAAGEVFTNAASAVTSSDATLNGTNGGVAANGHSFWVSLTPGIDTSSPSIPLGVYSTPVLAGVGAGASFSAQLTNVTGLPAVTSATTYYYVAWTNIGANWYPDGEQSFITLATLNYAAGANGSLTGSASQEVALGGNGAAVTAVPNAGYQFASWSDASTQNPRTDLSIAGNLSVTANFSVVTDYYVSTLGNDANDGSLATPFATINHAISVAPAGGTVHIAAGTYVENVVANKGITLDGAGDNANPLLGTVVAPAAGSAIEVLSGNVTLKDLRTSGGTYGIRVTGTSNTFAIDGVTATGATIGLRVGDGISINGLTVTNSHFDGNSAQGWYLSEGSAAGGMVTGVNVTNTTFNNNLQKGLYAEKLDNATFDGITVANSGTDATYGFNAGIDINLKWAAYSNITIKNSSVTGSGLTGTEPNPLFPAGITIKARDDAPTYSGMPASLSTVLIDNVTVSGGRVGIRFGEAGKTNAGPTGVTVVNSNISGTLKGLANESLTIPNAVNNYWGFSASSSVLAQISGTATVAPWYVDSVGGTLSNLASISSFDIASPAVSGAVGANTVTLLLPTGTDATNLTPSITFTGAYADPASATAHDFSTSPQVYTVTSIDGTVSTAYDVTTTEDQTITVTTNAPSSAVYGDVFVVHANSDSGLGVAITVTGGNCSGSGTNTAAIAITDVGGSCVVHYNQAGDSLFTAAPELTDAVSVSQKNITIDGMAFGDQVYDGTTDAHFPNNAGTLTALIPGDVVGFTGGTFSFADKHVGLDKTVSAVGITLTGGDAYKYTLTAQPTATADITPYAIDVTAEDDSKTYDSTDASGLTPTITGGTSVQTGDAAGFTQVFNSENIDASATVASGIVNDGNGGADYTYTFHNGLGVISPYTLTVSASASNKVYDGNADASVVLSQNEVSGDDVSTSYTSATFNDKTVGAGKLVTVSGISLSGADAGNYTFNTTATTNADITAKTLTLTPHVSNKVYDATTATAVTYTDDRVAGDVLGVSGFAAFNDKNAGTAKLVVLAPVSFFGPDSGNYTVSQPATTNADITTAPLTASFTASGKVYDGNTTAGILTQSLSGVILGDTVSVSGGSATFSNKNVGTNKTVTGTGFVLGDVDGANYSITVTNTTTATITKRTLTPTVVANDKVYNGSRNATVSVTDDRVTGVGDTFTLNHASFGSNRPLFDTKDVGTNKTVSVGGFFLTGSGASNYQLSATSGTDQADITPASLTASITASNKVYDGNADASATCAVAPIGADAVTCSIGGTATFDTQSAGMGKTVTATGITLGGAQAGNYTLTSSTATDQADITPAGLVVDFTSANKVYDADTTAALISPVISAGIIGADDVTVSGGSATFADKNVGTGKTVTGTGFVFGGAEAGNYSVATINTTTADITALSVDINFVANNKQFDSSTNATIAAATTTGVILGDTVIVSGGTASFLDNTVGTGKQVDATGFVLGGADGANYSVGTVNSASADITAAPAAPSGGGGGGGGGNGVPVGLLAAPSNIVASINAPAPAGEVLGAEDFRFTKNLSLGMRNSDVTELQKVLIAQGYLKIAAPTGYFGQLTLAAVKAYQKAHGIPQTGFVGPLTRAALNGN